MNSSESREGLEMRLQDTKNDLATSRKIRSYVAFVLTGSEESDVQIAADEAAYLLRAAKRQLSHKPDGINCPGCAIERQIDNLLGDGPIPPEDQPEESNNE